jgi:cell division protease FtsH
MDGFEENQGVIIVAATNRPDILDPALLRPGRFDRQVTVPNPDLTGREQILMVHMKKVPLSPNVDAKIIARGTPGFSGADLANLVNEAALLAARKGKLTVSMQEFDQAKDKVMMGTERRSMVMTDEEKKLTAYHEAGHALVGYYNPYSDPIHKATIIPRGRALGMVMRLPENDRISMSRKKLLADIEVAMGGRIAEVMIFGEDKVTTGASSDIKMASEMAQKMVLEWGMSDKLGFQNYVSNRDDVYSMTSSQSRHVSEATAKIIDTEVKLILDTCYKLAEKTLKEREKGLHLLAKELLERETLTGEEISNLLETGKIDPVDLSRYRSLKSSVPLSESI